MADPFLDLGSLTGSPLSSLSNVGVSDLHKGTCDFSSGSSGDWVFRWTAPSDGDFSINTDGSSFDTVLMLQGDLCGAELACDDQGGTTPNASQLNVTAVAGQTFIIVVGGHDSASGEFRLNILEDLCPADPAKAEPGLCGCGVADTDSDFDGTPDCLDLCPNDPTKLEPGTCGCGALDVDTDGDTVFDCTDVCPFDPLDGAGNDGVCACTTPFASVDLGSATGISISAGSTSGQPNLFHGTCNSGTAESSDLMFSWVAPATDTYQFSTDGSAFDTMLLLMGDGCGTELVCDDDSGAGFTSLLTASLVAGQTVYIVVGGYGSAAGAYELNITPATLAGPLPR